MNLSKSAANVWIECGKKKSVGQKNFKILGAIAKFTKKWHFLIGYHWRLDCAQR
jgi:hypothetical protein